MLFSEISFLEGIIYSLYVMVYFAAVYSENITVHLKCTFQISVPLKRRSDSMCECLQADVINIALASLAVAMTLGT